MRISTTLADFPVKEPVLTGSHREAYEILGQADGQVLAIDTQDLATAAAKRAFRKAAQARKVSVQFGMDSENRLLVKVVANGPTTREGRARRLVTQTRVQHTDDQVKAEAQRLYVSAGNPAKDFTKLSADAMRKLTISAKRNLSRAANGK